MWRRPLRVVGLVLVLAFSLLPTLATVQGHPFHLQAQNVNGAGGDEQVGATRWHAQSFRMGQGFTITGVHLFTERRTGSAWLTVSIRADDAGAPAQTALTSATVRGSSSPSWTNFTFDPWVALQGNATYWIVAFSNRPWWNGYNWWRSPDNSAYSNGTGAFSGDGGSTWSNEPYDYTFRVYGYQQPSLSYAVTASNPTPEPGDLVGFQINMTNAGPGVATKLWVNVSLPFELTYVSDTAGNLGGASLCCYSFEFDDLFPGSYAFNLTASVVGGVGTGTLATTRFDFEGIDHADEATPPFSQDVTLTIRSGALSLSLLATGSSVGPGEIVNYTLTVENVGAGRALNLDVTASVDPNATYQTSSPPAAYDPLERNLSWSASALAPVGSLQYAWSVRVNPSAPDLAQVVTGVMVTYEDATGTAGSPARESHTTTVLAPVFAPVLSVDRDVAEHGDEVLVTYFFNNTGSAPASAAWQNWTLGGHYALISLTPALNYAPSTAGFSVAHTNLSSGPHNVTARLRVLRGMVDGFPLPLQVIWEARISAGIPLPPVDRTHVITLQAPQLGVVLDTEITSVDVGILFSLDLRLRNLGQAPATGWLNLTLPGGVAYRGDGSPYVATVSEGRISWRLPSVPSGADMAFSVQLEASGPGVLVFRLEADYTDGKGSPSQVISSNAVFLDVAPAGLTVVDVGLWSALAVGGIVAGVLLWARRRRRELAIDEVFVVHRNGILLAHRSKTLTPDKDRDLLVAMLRAVQEFIQDAFASRDSSPVRSLTFGESNILIERGVNHSIAVVYRGRDIGALQAGLAELSRRVEIRFGEILASWSGDMDEVRGIRDLLPLLWGLAARGPDSSEGETGGERIRTLLRSGRQQVVHALQDIRDRVIRGPTLSEDLDGDSGLPGAGK